MFEGGMRGYDEVYACMCLCMYACVIVCAMGILYWAATSFNPTSSRESTDVLSPVQWKRPYFVHTIPWNT